jgi:hypothetical protein
MKQISNILIGLYDLFIMLPLGIETLISRSRSQTERPQPVDDNLMEKQL